MLCNSVKIYDRHWAHFGKILPDSKKEFINCNPPMAHMIFTSRWIFGLLLGCYNFCDYSRL